MPARAPIVFLAVAAVVGIWFLPLDGWQADAEADDIEERRRERVRVVAELAHLSGELAEGRATLAETAARFLAVYRASPQVLAVVRRRCPGATDEQAVAWQAASFAVARVTDPDRRAAVRARLAAELEQLYPGAEPIPSD